MYVTSEETTKTMEYVPDFNKAYGPDFDILRIADEFGKVLLSTNFHSIAKPDANGNIHIDMGSSNPTDMATHQLQMDGYVKEFPESSQKVYLTGEGRYFMSRGGYEQLWKDREEDRKLNKDQIDSVIKTNKSVRTINNLFWITLIISVTSLGIQLTGFIKDYNAGATLDKIQQRIENQEQQILRMQQQPGSAKSVGLHETTLKDSAN